jgi:hypothetical protein
LLADSASDRYQISIINIFNITGEKASRLRLAIELRPQAGILYFHSETRNDYGHRVRKLIITIFGQIADIMLEFDFGDSGGDGSV